MSDRIPNGLDMPQARALVPVIVDALRELGGEAHRREIIATAVRIGPFTDAQRAEPSHVKGRKATHESELHHRLSWAMSHARIAGEIENARLGVWRLSADA